MKSSYQKFLLLAFIVCLTALPNAVKAQSEVVTPEELQRKEAAKVAIRRSSMKIKIVPRSQLRQKAAAMKTMKTKIQHLETYKCLICNSNTHETSSCHFKCKMPSCKTLEHHKKLCPYYKQY